MISRIVAGLSGVSRWAWIGMGAILLSGALWVAILRGQVSEAQNSVKALSEALTASEAEVAQLREIRKADTAAATTKAEQVRVITIKEAKANEVLTKALEANVDWASQPVPADVRDSLLP